MDSESTPRHPIRVVARRTGLTPATIRAWERRYDVLEPERSEGGQRLYSDQDVDRLDTLRQLTDGGRSISSVARLPAEEAKALLLEDRAAAVPVHAAPPGASLQAWIDQAYDLVRSLDDDGLERILWRAFTTLGAHRFLGGVVTPLLWKIGSGWAEGDVSPAQEHLASEVIDRVLAELTDRSLPTTNGTRLVVATLPGERHGLGARLVAVAAALQGWSAKNLGTDLPPTEIAAAATTLGAKAVAISVVTSEIVRDTIAALEELRTLLPRDVALWVGGRASKLLAESRLPDGIHVLPGVEALEAFQAAPPAAPPPA